jgi:hypothetical protein
MLVSLVKDVTKGGEETDIIKLEIDDLDVADLFGRGAIRVVAYEGTETIDDKEIKKQIVYMLVRKSR